MNDILRTIELSNDDPSFFIDFCAMVQDYMRPSITFYMVETYHTPRSSKKHPAIYIITCIDGKGVKRVMINEGLVINVVSIATLQSLGISLFYLSAPTLAVKAFNNTLSTTLGVVMIPIKVGVRSVPMPYHVVEGEMQHNILLV